MKIYKITEASDYLGVSINTLKTLVNNNKINSFGHVSPFERIKRTNEAGAEFWSSRDFSEVLDYGDYRNFERVVDKVKLACFNSGHRVEDHFVDVTEMVQIGSGAT